MITINPKIFVTYTKSGYITVKPIVFLTYAESEAIADTTNIDTRRSLQQTDPSNADTVRIFGMPDSTNASAQRMLQADDQTAGDLSRMTQQADIINADLSRAVTISDSSTADTRRAVYRTDDVMTDVVRRLRADDIANADLRRTIAAQTYDDSTNASIYKLVRASDRSRADMQRLVQSADQSNVDTVRNLASMDDVVTADLIRHVSVFDQSNADTHRVPAIGDAVSADAVRHISHMTKTLNPSQITIRLQSKMLTDTFSMTVPYDLDLEASVSGQLLDFPYNFLVYDSSGVGLMRNITGMYDIDKLLYTPFTYYASSSLTAAGHARMIADGIGKSLHISIDDFIPSTSYSGTGATYQNIISGLFGWLDNLPQRCINVFIRGDDLYILQRGKESNSIDITGTHHSRPQIDRHFMRSVWSGKGSSSARSVEVEPEPYSGTVKFGNSSVTYSNGLVTEEVSEVSGGTETTVYSYSIDDYLTGKITTTADSTITTSYDYASTGNDKYLATETEVTVSNKDSSDTTTRITQHVYLGNGWYGTTTYQDGERQGSSVGQGRPGGKASKYLIDQSNTNLGSTYPSDDSSMFGTALFDTDFPVASRDTGTLITLTQSIEWLNRKTEERISMDIWQYSHVIDFTDRIIYNGNVYYLESNTISRSPRELKQSIEIVRWY